MVLFSGSLFHNVLRVVLSPQARGIRAISLAWVPKLARKPVSVSNLEVTRSVKKQCWCECDQASRLLPLLVETTEIIGIVYTVIR